LLSSACTSTMLISVPTDIPLPYTTLFRSDRGAAGVDPRGAPQAGDQPRRPRLLRRSLRLRGGGDDRPRRVHLGRAERRRAERPRRPDPERGDPSDLRRDHRPGGSGRRPGPGGGRRGPGLHPVHRLVGRPGVGCRHLRRHDAAQRTDDRRGAGRLAMDWLAEPFSHAFMQRAAVAGILAAVTTALVGTWVVIRGLTFMGDALAHGVLPGIALA